MNYGTATNIGSDSPPSAAPNSPIAGDQYSNMFTSAMSSTDSPQSPQVDNEEPKIVYLNLVIKDHSCWGLPDAFAHRVLVRCKNPVPTLMVTKGVWVESPTVYLSGDNCYCEVIGCVCKQGGYAFVEVAAFRFDTKKRAEGKIPFLVIIPEGMVDMSAEGHQAWWQITWGFMLRYVHCL
ncbi:hypothetical protein K443DRAFT_126149 [Laccaria amethystina LaAM-08-1]|uniref:Uncharacterized protein n=1 Tax=Laccaria amethystina LaAM-08-1 TaxID=1095629 RepID=A0A0C9X298_9AGAR|nr:hypothetical protein K443DRAFT_126149 [Laccaria amethystina LaAM-08-1]